MEPLLPATPETHILRLPPDGHACDRCNELLDGEAFAYFIEYMPPDPGEVTVRDAQLVVCRNCAVELGDGYKLQG